MSAPPFADWALAFLQVLYRTQVALARVLHFIGVTGDADGQAAWPWPQRIALETLRIDAGLTRQLALAFALTALAAALALAALVLRRRRVIWAGAAVLAGVCAPWPPAALWLCARRADEFPAQPHAVVGDERDARRAAVRPPLRGLPRRGRPRRRAARRVARALAADLRRHAAARRLDGEFTGACGTARTMRHARRRCPASTRPTRGPCSIT